MNGQVITILNKIQKDLVEVKKRLEDLEPIYGSKAWWIWSDKLALKDYKEGSFKKTSSKSELQKLLKSFIS